MVISKKALMVITTFITLNANTSPSMEIGESSTNGIQLTQETSSGVGDGTIFNTEKSDGDINSNVLYSENASKGLQYNDGLTDVARAAYKELATILDFKIPCTNWNDSDSVGQRQAQIKNELLAELPHNEVKVSEKVSETAGHPQLEKAVKNCLVFEKLYTKYTSATSVNVSEQEYCNVFDTISPADNKENVYNSYCELFDRVCIHRWFVITKAADDRNVLDNASILQKYSECIKNEYSLCVSNSEVCSSNHYNRWSLAYSVFYREPFINLFDGYKSQLEKIQNKIIDNIVLQ